MTKLKFPAAPRHLAPATKKWWSSVVRAYVLEEHHLRLLRLACEAWDRGQLAREVLKKKGLTFEDRFGTPKTRPEIKIANDAAITFARMVRELDLDTETPADTSVRPPSLRSNRR